MAIFTCTTAAELTAAITACAYGDTIRLLANATFTHSAGGWQFPEKAGYTPGAEILVITTASAGLPSNGTRIRPSHASLLPKLQSTRSQSYLNTPSVRVMPGAKGWKFQYVEVHPTWFGSQSAIRVGSTLLTEQWRKDQQCESITFRHVYVPIVNRYHGNRRGIERHGVNIQEHDCWIEADCAHIGQAESACILTGNGNGPYRTTNNELVGGTQGMMSGGFDTVVRTRATVQASPAASTTSAFVSWAASEKADADPPVVGQHIAIPTLGNTMYRHATVVAYTPSSSNTGLITFTPIEEVPAVGFEIRWGVNTDDVEITGNYFRRVNHAYVVEQPSAVAASAAPGGTLTDGTYNVRVAHRVRGFQATMLNSLATDPIAVTVTAGQKLTGTLTPHANIVAAAEGETRVYVQLPGATWRYITLAAAATSWEFPDLTTGTLTTSVLAGHTWRTKNSLEFKTGTNVLVEGNIFEEIRGDEAWWVKEVNQDGRGQYSRTKDVILRKNIVRTSGSWLSVSGREFPTDMGQEGRTAGMVEVEITNNLVYDTNVEPYRDGVTMYAMNLANGCRNLNIHHNTVYHGRQGIAILTTPAAREWPFANLKITDNLLRRFTYGIKGASSPSTAEGTLGIAAHTGGAYDVTRNFIEGSSGAYPEGNTFLSTEDFDALFENTTAKDFSLADGSDAIGAGLAGSDLGADIAAVLAATATVVSGNSAVAATPVIVTTALPSATVGQAYSATLLATEGVAPYTWAITGGTLAGSGLSLAAGTGIISGTPSTATTLSLTFRATDSQAAQSATRVMSLQIQPAATAPLVMRPAAVPPAVVGTGYSFTLEATGGVQPYSWNIEGVIPTGLEVSRTSGTLSGAPTTAGGYVLTWAVTDAAGETQRQELVLTVLSTAAVELVLTDLDRVALAWKRQHTSPSTSFVDFVRSIADGAIAPIRREHDLTRAAEVASGYVASPLATRNTVEADLGLERSTVPED